MKTLFRDVFVPTQTTPGPLSDSMITSIYQFVDNSCEALLVFVDGVLHPSLSKSIDTIPTSVIFKSLSSMSEEEKSIIAVSELLTYVPDSLELPRNSFGSDWLTSLNTVSETCTVAYEGSNRQSVLSNFIPYVYMS